jgi:hypothetical protein
MRFRQFFFVNSMELDGFVLRSCGDLPQNELRFALYIFLINQVIKKFSYLDRKFPLIIFNSFTIFVLFFDCLLVGSDRFAAFRLRFDELYRSGRQSVDKNY